MMSPSSVASLSYIAMFILLLPSGGLQNTEKATSGTGQAYTWNHIIKKHEEGSISFSSETHAFLSLEEMSRGKSSRGWKEHKQVLLHLFYCCRESQDAHVPQNASKSPPCDSVCTRHTHVQIRVWTDAEGSSMLGR